VAVTSNDTFPRQYARTQRFTLGEPRNLTVSDDGERVVFLRSAGGSDPVNSLWVLDVGTGEERLVADPEVLLAGTASSAGDTDGEPSDLERARRERLRESATGITAYATDDTTSVVAFALAGRLFVGGLRSGRARPLEVTGPVFDPRPDPTAKRIAYVSGRQLRIAELDGRSRALVGDDSDSAGPDTANPKTASPNTASPNTADTVSWGSADFIAAEEMGRYRGFWWSPDGTALAVCRVDVAPVDEWVIADPASPHAPARTVRYPAAGTANAVVTLHVIGLDGTKVDVDWDREFFPYLATVDWTAQGLLMSVQARDQRGTMTMKVDPSTGETSVLAHDYDDAWVELVAGVPSLLGDGRLVATSDRDGVRRLTIDGEPVTPDDLHVRSVLATSDGSVTFQANAADDATELHVWRWTDDELTAITTESGVHSAVVGGTTTVVRTATLDEAGARIATLDGHRLTSHAERPMVVPNVEIFAAGERRLATAVLLPHDHDGSPLPVLLDPYGGPHALRVLRSSNAFVSSQWFADQGFAVVVADGRGTPGRGTDWERAVHRDLATAPLADQIDALHAAAERFDVLDLERVAIRGWSFGGYLAALAVLRRPDVFHAAIAGAPVTNMRLYDTHYTERYLGHPDDDDAGYDACSLLPLAPDLVRPLLLIHGLADDNVVAAHTLQLSSALLAAGRPHEVLPLVGVSHMTPQEHVAENLLLHQLDFLRRSLGLERPPLDVHAPDAPTSEDSAPEDSAPEDPAPEDTAPEDSASENTASEDTASEDSAPER
jgi:dipeptidyl-peptidase 4